MTGRLTPFLAVDPGRNAGWAAFDAQGRLTACGLTTEPYALPQRLGGWPVLVIEEPHEGDTKARKRDVIQLAVRMGVLITLAQARSVVRVQPVQWKGGVPKKIMVPRIKDRWMTPEDRAIVANCRTQRHDVVDAVGLGIWWCRVNGARGPEGPNELGVDLRQPTLRRHNDSQEERRGDVVRSRVARSARNRGPGRQGFGHGSR